MKSCFSYFDYKTVLPFYAQPVSLFDSGSFLLAFLNPPTPVTVPGALWLAWLSLHITYAQPRPTLALLVSHFSQPAYLSLLGNICSDATLVITLCPRGGPNAETVMRKRRHHFLYCEEAKPEIERRLATAQLIENY